jgi:predicted transcriptional regulator with HTH domain
MCFGFLTNKNYNIMNAEELYNRKAFKHQLKRAIKHDYAYYKGCIVGLMEEYHQEKLKNLNTSLVGVAFCPKCGCNKITGDGTKSWCLNSNCDFIEAE